MAVVTGWNYIDFDHVYLINRFRNIGGDPTIISPTNNLRKAYNHNKDASAFNNKDVREMPAHKLIIDYMELYKKWDQSIKIKESNDLNFVAGAILGEKFGKVSYMGDLKHLYATDKKNFMFYNVIDSVLVQLIHEKTKLIDILYGIGTLARICVNNAFSTLAVTEGFLREQMRAEKNIIFVRPSDDDEDDDMAAVEGSVSGGFVLNPIKGMSEYTMCYDFSSLYPTTMRQLNISTDSYKGQLPMLKNKRGEMVPDFTSKKCKFNNHDIDVDPTDIKLLNGAVFVNEDGIVVQQITKIFLDRKKYKGMMQAEHEKLEDLKKLRTELEQCVVR
jgi:DNA polymerase elongation subunit (family B)